LPRDESARDRFDTISDLGRLERRFHDDKQPRLMLIDLTNLSEDELIELNCRIVERLQLIGSAKRLAQLARFSVGMTVCAATIRSAAWRQLDLPLRGRPGRCDTL